MPSDNALFCVKTIWMWVSLLWTLLPFCAVHGNKLLASKWSRISHRIRHKLTHWVYWVYIYGRSSRSRNTCNGRLADLLRKNSHILIKMRYYSSIRNIALPLLGYGVFMRILITWEDFILELALPWLLLLGVNQIQTSMVALQLPLEALIFRDAASLWFVFDSFRTLGHSLFILLWLRICKH